MFNTEFSLDKLLQETLEMTEFMGMEHSNSVPMKKQERELQNIQPELFQTDFVSSEDSSDFSNDFNDDLVNEAFEALTSDSVPAKNEAVVEELEDDIDYLMDLADTLLSPPVDFSSQPSLPFVAQEIKDEVIYPETSGIVYRIDDGGNTFCIRGMAVENISLAMKDLRNIESTKRTLLKIHDDSYLSTVHFFKTKNVELAESIREQIINRRFPKMEDSVCNISDPGFSWWMDVSLKDGEGRFEIFFKAHAVNRAEKYIQLGPIGDGAIAAMRMNQARTLLRSSFPVTEFVCTERSLTVATSKPDHLSFISFKNIFLLGENHTEEENFPDNSLGKTLYFYFHEIAVLRKFWIEVQKRLS